MEDSAMARMDAKEKGTCRANSGCERRAAAKAIRNQETVIAAQSEAARRAADLRRDACWRYGCC